MTLDTLLKCSFDENNNQLCLRPGKCFDYNLNKFCLHDVRINKSFECETPDLLCFSFVLFLPSVFKHAGLCMHKFAQ